MSDTSSSFFPSASERRTFRDELGRGIGRYIPPEMRSLLGFVAEATPSASLERAGSASMEAVAPDRTAMERVGSLGAMLSETAGVAAPLVAAPRAAIPASEALQEALLGASVPARAAAETVFERLNQPGEVPVMYSGFDPEAIIRALREGVPAAEARLADDMRIGNERIRAESFARMGEVRNTPEDFGFFQDNPALSRGDTDWLRGKQEAAEASYDERRGITGSTTATLGSNEQDMFLPTEFLRNIPGLRNERRVPGESQFDALMQDVQERGFRPDQDGNKIVLGVNHRGEPFLVGGNTRVAVANEIGVPNVRVEVRYKNGGEMVDGPFSPENISRIAARGPQEYAKGGEVMMRGDMSKQLEGGIGGFAGDAKNMFRGPRGIGGFAQYMQDGGEVGRGQGQGSTVGRPVSGSAMGTNLGADEEFLTSVRNRVIEQSGVDPIKVAMEEGVDPDLFLRLVAQESGGRSNAESDAGAYGFTQLMDATARELGVDRTDPEQNLRGGARYLRQQLDRFQEVPLALAAYNAGPTAVERFGGIPPYSETRNYVARILGVSGGEMGVGPQMRPDPIVPTPRPAVQGPSLGGDPLMALGQMVEQTPFGLTQSPAMPEQDMPMPRNQPQQTTFTRGQGQPGERMFIDLMRTMP